LSIVLVTLSILALNVLFGVSITALHSLLIIIVITIIPAVFYFLRRLIKKANNRKSV
jgi:hypothetical protein